MPEPGDGPQRRTLIEAGFAAAAVAGIPFTGQVPAVAASVSGTGSEVADAGSEAASDWRRYVLEPTTHNVSPIHVIATTGDVRDSAALLKPGGAPTALPYGTVTADNVAIDLTAYLGAPQSHAGRHHELLVH